MSAVHQPGSLTISWSLTSPPLVPEAASVWHNVPANCAAIDSDFGTEQGLDLSPGTLAILRWAFAQGLSRSAGMQGDLKAAEAAARIYKRGIAWRREDGAPFLARRHGGRYEVRFVSSARPPMGTAAGKGLTIVDANVAAAWPDLKWGGEVLRLGLDEHSKTLASVAQILDAAKKISAAGPQHWTVVGGGLLSDVAAFAAGLANAAIEFIPTTLLAMADACVGGKTGVNFPPYGKNQVGLFYFPCAVTIWPGWLRTLPLRELAAGGAECLKHAVLAGDPRLANTLAEALATNDLTELAVCLPEVVQFKAEVVAEDPGESGRRATLNFGHTLAHALEAVSQARTTGETTLLHGEAVALGMVFATVLSRRVAGLPPDVAMRLISLLQRSGIVISARELAERLGFALLDDAELLDELLKHIGHDKKNLQAVKSGVSEWILLDAPGQVARESLKTWTTAVFAAEVRNAWAEFLRELS